MVHDYSGFVKLVKLHAKAVALLEKVEDELTLLHKIYGAKVLAPARNLVAGCPGIAYFHHFGSRAT